jgi:hypothetical protein
MEKVDNLSHYWVGSLCRSYCTPNVGQESNHILSFPPAVVGSSDIIRILEDLGNNIPDKSWMLYLLELFDSGILANNKNHTAIELNLICQFNDRDNFWAILGGVNRYKFNKVVPKIGHSYLREIILNRYDNSIEYCVSDLTDNNMMERFTLQLGTTENRSISFKCLDQFTGIEWWNKSERYPFPIRYKIEFSNLSYMQIESGLTNAHKNSIESRTLRPYDALVPNRDGYAKEYPVIFFRRSDVKDNSLAYIVTHGSCKIGLRYISAR